MTKLKLAILISGRGSNMEAIVKAIQAGHINAEITAIISNNENAAGLEFAKANNIPTKVLSHIYYKSREEFDRALSDLIKLTGANFVCLAGFMRVLTEQFIDDWYNKLINIHPSLLPAFKGLNTHKRAIEKGVKFAGCTVHYVRADVDNGPIISQAATTVSPDDTPDSLAAKILKLEHQIYPQALAKIANGEITIDENKIEFKNYSNQQQSLIN